MWEQQHQQMKPKTSHPGKDVMLPNTIILFFYFAVKASSVRGKSGLTGGAAAPATSAVTTPLLLAALLLTAARLLQ